MNGHKSSLIFWCLLVFYVLMAVGCASVDTLKKYGTLPPTVKEAMFIKLLGTESEMIDSGIYLNEGEPYSIVAAAGLSRATPYISFFDQVLLLEARIGQEPCFTPLSGTHYNLNGTTRIAHANGNLYLALEIHSLPLEGIAVAGISSVDVFIIVWKTDDMAQIAGSLQRLKEKEANSFGAVPEFIKGFDDAIDRTKELWNDFGFRTLDSGFAPEIVYVKNHRRVTP
jgi:hypothetical protein